MVPGIVSNTAAMEQRSQHDSHLGWSNHLSRVGITTSQVGKKRKGKLTSSRRLIRSIPIFLNSAYRQP